MEEQLISFETANLAEEKGYPFTYVPVGEVGDVPTNIPTQSLLQKWLREKHGIEVNAIPTGLRESKRYIPRFWFCGFEYNSFDFATYEEALERGLLEALKLIKND